jgi:predicted nucleotidyltransferase
MKLEKLIEERRGDILRISRLHGGRSVRLFGSYVRRASTEASDVDVLVELEPGSSLLDLVAIKQDLEDLLGCKVDVVTESSLSPYIREDVLKEAIAL